MNLQPLGKIDTGWGYEIVWANNDKYCAKLLVFERAGAKTSLVFHKDKKKSWFVNVGKFKITYIDIATGETREAILEEGKTADFAELSPHQVESLVAGSIIFEVGTADYVEDRFRLSPGDTQILMQQSNPTS
jgi:hypothetical protein